MMSARHDHDVWPMIGGARHLGAGAYGQEPYEQEARLGAANRQDTCESDRKRVDLRLAKLIC